MELPKFKLNDPRLWHYRAFIHRVIDGDTVALIIDRGFGNFQDERLRLGGIDAPETRPRRGTPEERDAERVAGKLAKERVAELCEGKEVIIKTHKTGKFGRFLGSIYVGGADVSVNQMLLDEGLAIRYGDEKPTDWIAFRARILKERAGA